MAVEPVQTAWAADPAGPAGTSGPGHAKQGAAGGVVVDALGLGGDAALDVALPDGGAAGAGLARWLPG